MSNTQSETESKLRRIERENDKLMRNIEQLKREHASQVQLSARQVSELQATIVQLENSNQHRAAALHVELRPDEHA